MKASIWAVTLLSLCAVAAACSSGSGDTSVFPSGSTHGSTSGSSSSGGIGGTNFTTSTTASSSGVGGADCGALLPDTKSCIACEAGKYPTGAMLYNAITDCVYCSECYTDCDGKNLHGCATPPAMKGACDGAAPDPTACGDSTKGCVKCAYAGACQPAVNACIANQECANYGSALQNDCKVQP